MHSVLLGIYLEAELLVHSVHMHLALRDVAKQFSKVFILIYTPSAIYESFSSTIMVFFSTSGSFLFSTLETQCTTLCMGEFPRRGLPGLGQN